MCVSEYWLLEGYGITRYHFFIDDKIHCFWDKDPIETNLEFIDRFDDKYFDFIAKHAVSIIESDSTTDKEKSYMSIILRNSYSYSLESFFAFLSATIQATDFIPGWLLNYKSYQLYSVIEKIEEEKFIENKLFLEKISWKNIVNQIFCIKSDDENKKKEIKDKFTLLWKRLSKDFLNQSMRDEYNSIKHGFRVEEGGFHLNFSKEDTPGKTAKNTKTKTLGGSKYGSSFFSTEKLTNNKPHFVVHKNSRNWPLVRYAKEIVLISYSLKNLKAFLKIKNGIEPEKVRFTFPEDLSFLDMHLEDNPGVLEFNLHNEIEADKEHLLSKVLLKERYDSIYKNRNTR